MTCLYKGPAAGLNRTGQRCLTSSLMKMRHQQTVVLFTVNLRDEKHSALYFPRPNRRGASLSRTRPLIGNRRWAFFFKFTFLVWFARRTQLLWFALFGKTRCIQQNTFPPGISVLHRCTHTNTQTHTHTRTHTATGVIEMALRENKSSFLC